MVEEEADMPRPGGGGGRAWAMEEEADASGHKQGDGCVGQWRRRQMPASSLVGHSTSWEDDMEVFVKVNNEAMQANSF